jgi:diguanylate cyclase (GGDEF)-like protein
MAPAPRILVLAGDAVEAAACELALETGLPGCSVMTERTAEGGLSAARSGGVDVVVVGAELPDGHELDVIRSLSAEPAAPPIVAILGRGSERLAATVLAAGATDALAAGRDFTVALADSVAIAYGYALRERRRAGLVALADRLDAESEPSGVLDAAVAGLALTLDADAASAWLRSSTGDAEAHLAAPLGASADAMAAHFDDAPEAGETLVRPPEEVGELALAWGASPAGDAVLLAVRRGDAGWPPDDLRWLELATHATLGALARTLERDRTRDEPDGDDVTGLPGERRFLSALEAESERARRQSAPVAMLLVEVDGLDAVAERYGHEVVAAILREAGEAVAGSVRGYDLPARVGPQGFGVLLPAADRAEAEVVAERIRFAIAAIEFPAVGRLTVSLGLAAYPEAVESVQALLEAAEQALLVGRRSGDVVVAAPARRTDEPPAGRW